MRTVRIAILLAAGILPAKAQFCQGAYCGWDWCNAPTEQCSPDGCDAPWGMLQEISSCGMCPDFTTVRGYCVENIGCTTDCSFCMTEPKKDVIPAVWQFDPNKTVMNLMARYRLQWQANGLHGACSRYKTEKLSGPEVIKQNLPFRYKVLLDKPIHIKGRV